MNVAIIVFIDLSSKFVRKLASAELAENDITCIVSTKKNYIINFHCIGILIWSIYIFFIRSFLTSLLSLQKPYFKFIYLFCT